MYNSNYYEYRVQSIKHIINNRFRKLLLPIVIMLFAYFSNTEAIAQCQPGYTLRTDTISVNGCNYAINMCVKCAVGPAPGDVILMEFIKLGAGCLQTWNAQQVLTYINNHIKTSNYLLMHLCLAPIPYPCPAQGPEYTFRYWLCFNIEKISYFGEDHIVYRPCDYDNWCEEKYTYCYNPQTQKIEGTRTSGPTMVGSINCGLEAHMVPEPTEYDEPTECFIYHSPCNP